RAGYEIINNLCEQAVKRNNGEIQWEFVHGLFDQAI
ncbi:unnamed protein product, partial [Didymodactylos carnosus]